MQQQVTRRVVAAQENLMRQLRDGAAAATNNAAKGSGNSSVEPTYGVSEGVVEVRGEQACASDGLTEWEPYNWLLIKDVVQANKYHEQAV